MEIFCFQVHTIEIPCIIELETITPLLLSFLFGVAPHGILEYAVNCLAFAMGIYLWKT